jgi:hypothetical protein
MDFLPPQLLAALQCPLVSCGTAVPGSLVQHVFSPLARTKVCTQPIHRGRAAALKTLCIKVLGKFQTGIAQTYRIVTLLGSRRFPLRPVSWREPPSDR